MKKGLIIGGLVVIVVVAGGFAYYESTNKVNNVSNTTKPNVVSSSKNTANNTSSNANLVMYAKPNFSEVETKNYYTLSQNVGDIGLPSAAMVANIDMFKNIDGVNYYKTYSYDTRAAYNNDNTTPSNGNYSHFLNMKIVSLDGQTISENSFGTLDTSNLTNQDKYNDIYKMAAMYVEGYTANNPKLVVTENDNYEGNLNATPDIKVNLNNTKVVNGETLYQVVVNVNNYTVPIYVGIDGYIYVASQSDFNKIFFPIKVQ